jgi:hypothetical protein
MTHALDALTRSIDAALKTEQIGTPVAARVVVHQDADHGLVERLAARALEAAAGWLESRPERLAALGGVERGQISLLARFAGGQSALVSVSARGSGSPLMEAVVWGNRGTVSWEESAGFRDVEPEDGEPPLSKEATRLLAMIREALATSESSARGDAVSPSPVPATRLAPPPKPPWGVLLVAGDHTHQPNYAEALAADPRCS